MRFSKTLAGAAAAALALLAAACGEQPQVANTNTPAPNVNASPSTGGTPASPADTGGITAREPDKYRATYVISGQTTGAQTAAAAFQMEIARNGADRRFAFDTRLPSVGKVVFLDKADKRYLILEGQKRYMELTPEMTGFEVPRAMTPGMMIEQLQKQPGVTKVGEEQLNGRTVVKYRYAGTAATGTAAGEVRGETFVYVDKETELPVKVEAASAATGQVQGATGGTAGMELRDLSTDVDPALFELPAGYTKLSEQEMRQMQQTLGMALQMLASMAGGGGAGGAAPPRAATPTATATPAGR